MVNAGFIIGRRKFLVVLTLGLASMLSGCSCSSPSVGEISGTVRYQGQALKSETIDWTVVFVSPDGRRGTGHVDSDGNYTANNVPTGKVKIAVVGVPPGAIGMPDPRQSQARVDEKSKSILRELASFKNPDDSGLTFTVKEGPPQKYDIDLPP